MLVGTFNQEKALEGAFSVIVKIDCGTDGALHSTSCCDTRERVSAAHLAPGFQFITQGWARTGFLSPHHQFGVHNLVIGCRSSASRLTTLPQPDMVKPPYPIH